MHDSTSESSSSGGGGFAPGRLRLVIVDGDNFRTEVLPDAGNVTLGRSGKCEIVIDNNSISRFHARIDIDDDLTIEDLGSANGTMLGDERLVVGEPTPFGIGDALTLGSVTVVVQKSTAQARAKRIWPHGYFEGRIEEECMRSERARTEFAVVRLIGDTANIKVMEDALASAMRGIDVIGNYAPGDYEILMTDSSRVIAERTVGRLIEQLVSRGVTMRAGIAMYPADGRTADELISHAGSHHRRGAKRTDPPPLVGGGMGRLEALTRRVAASPISVLILGETGAGKEVLAGQIHRLSPRANKPFLALNCASLSETLLESELFGHERGAFTGADRAHVGVFEAAHGGTIFLDEIGELGPTIQATLLGVLERRKLKRLGSRSELAVDVRVVAATHRDLRAEVNRGTFRLDLFYRLAVVTLSIPALRERPDDIPLLVEHFLRDAGWDKPIAALISPQAMEALQRLHFGGNVRELRNLVDAAVAMGEPPPLETPAKTAPRGTPLAADLGLPYKEARAQLLDQFEAQYLEALLERAGGNISAAARIARMTRSHLSELLAKRRS